MKRSFAGCLKRYFKSVIIACVLTFAIYSFLSIKSPVACANTLSCTESLRLEIDNSAVGIFNNKKVSPPKISFSPDALQANVLGDSTEGKDKLIYVNLTNQTLSAYQGKTLFMKTLISSGKWTPTPTGEYAIWEKLRATRMSGGEGDDFYDLPNVPYVMFFYNGEVSKAAGYSLHGTYWHNNFGHAMSHGCINMRITDAKKLYEWANPKSYDAVTIAGPKNPGTTVIIYGTTP